MRTCVHRKSKCTLPAGRQASTLNHEPSTMSSSIIVLTGAGMSAESGISTFRDSNGLWENHRVEDVASPIAWERNPKLVMNFYNLRRKNVMEAEPNAGHLALVKLEEKYDVRIITQNVDDLHERAGSSNVLHLHGEIRKARSTVDENLIYPVDGWELCFGDLCEKGSQLRPHIVWFGEAVPMMTIATRMARQADILIVIGTSLMVYPAAGLLYDVPDKVPKFLIDPKASPAYGVENLTIIRETAGSGVPALVERLMKQDRE